MENPIIKNMKKAFNQIKQNMILAESNSSEKTITKEDRERFEKFHKQIELYYGRIHVELTPFQELAESIAYFKHVVFIHLIEPWALPIVKGVNWLIRKASK